ncbi:hydrolase [Vibrio inusitatus NBRC 102082]|uniref:Hydrolase n=1 Tax=Vibrio inusitatus NBRC 102082 TaxID=1219070 RepID=A0A4Y3HT42_9VIBR|nr:alkyl sulfatase dimerization domain-containing protein [Vibrio inusitatus]GEA50319.1 hydrolase [Vibrio inusitatus NBRC 102082]
MLNKKILSLAICASFIASTSLASTATGTLGLTPDAKPASEYTLKSNEEVKDYLNFADKSDFDDAKRGFIATWPESKIMADDGGVAWDFSKYDFIQEGKDIDTINPSLLRVAQLNNLHGLYQVSDGIYQVRGFDLSVMSFVRGEKGWIVIDPLLTVETARAGLSLLQEHVENVPVTNVIYTHSHIDHFGGVRGVTTQADVDAGKVKVYAPKDFFRNSIDENVLAGTAMSRRASFMYGNLLSASETGQVDGGLGKTTSTGLPTIIKETVAVVETGSVMKIDGLDVEFQMAQHSEAPSEFMFYFPKYRAFMASEVLTNTIHNISTLRGAKTRDASLWAGYVDESLTLFGDRSDVMFASHHWPTWGTENIKDQISKTRDQYKFVHDQVLRLANMGMTTNEISNTIKLPDSLGKEWYNRGYYGTVSHNARATYDFYFGAWWDGNPANLNPMSPTDEGERYVKAFGGEDKVVDAAREFVKDGEYRFAVRLLNHVIFSNPNNKEARYLSADAMEQLGYQAESGPWRNYYLGGAKELRQGIKPVPTPNTAAIAVNMPFESFLRYLSVTVNPEKAANLDLRVNFNVEGEGKYSVELSNSVLKTYNDRQFDDAQANVTMTRATFEKLVTKKASPEALIKSGEIEVTDVETFQKLFGSFDTFNLWFGVVTP